MFKKFLSRKLVAVLGTTIVVPFLLNHGVPPGTVDWLMGVVATYLAGQSVVDTVVAAKVAPGA
jgi:hypothetical protein